MSNESKQHVKLAQAYLDRLRTGVVTVSTRIGLSLTDRESDILEIVLVTVADSMAAGHVGATKGGAR